MRAKKYPRQVYLVTAEALEADDSTRNILTRISHGMCGIFGRIGNSSTSEFTRGQVRIDGGSSKPSPLAIRSLGTGVLVTIPSRDPRLVGEGSHLRALGRTRIIKARPTYVRPPVYLKRITNR